MDWPVGVGESQWWYSKKHRGTGHNKAIDDFIADLKINQPNAAEIRKNQQQVDSNGNKVGSNRPDIQYDLNGIHYNVEFDTTAKGSQKHQNEIPKNDPNSRNTFWMIDDKGNVIEGSLCTLWKNLSKIVIILYLVL